MSKSATPGQRARKRAMRLSLRTFQLAPSVVRETEQGEPVVELGSVRLVLPEGAEHFRHLARCSRCNQESLGDVVLHPTQLWTRPQIYCDACTQASIEFSSDPAGNSRPPVTVLSPGEPERVEEPSPGGGWPVMDYGATRASGNGSAPVPIESGPQLREQDQGPGRAQLVPALLDPLEEHRHALASKLRAVLADFDRHSQRSDSDTEPRLADAPDQERHDPVSELASTLADLEATFLSVHKDMSEGLAAIGERAASTRTLVAGLLQLTRERVLAAVTDLASEVSTLDGGMSDTRQRLAQLEAEMDELRHREVVRARATAPVFAGLGVAAPPPAPQQPVNGRVRVEAAAAEDASRKAAVPKSASQQAKRVTTRVPPPMRVAATNAAAKRPAGQRAGSKKPTAGEARTVTTPRAGKRAAPGKKASVKRPPNGSAR